MSKENEVIEIEDAVEVSDITTVVDENGNDTTDWKAQAEANLELAKRNQGIAQRNKTRLQKLKEERENAFANPNTKNESVSSDLGEKAYLAVNGIKSADEIAFVQKMKKETGKDVESLLETTYFQTEFRTFKEKKETDNAVPSGNKRSGNSSVDSVEYWLAKGELPPADQVQLRRDVVNARLKKEQTKGVFYNS